MTVREVHGVAGARKTEGNFKTNVRVIDSTVGDEIYIGLTDEVIVAINIEQARFLARCLTSAATRAEKKKLVTK